MALQGTSGHNPVVDGSAETVTEKRKPLGKEVFYSHYFALSPLIIGIKIPVAIKKQGHPKGHTLTTIGLPCKR